MTLQLNTPVALAPASFSIGHANRMLLMGSCFTETIGQRLSLLRFPTLVNPFGILYNPLSMAEALRRCLEGCEIDGSLLVSHEGLWHSWLHHGSFSRADREECLRACNHAIREAHDFLDTADTLMVTFGSAWCFTVPDGEGKPLVVGNCHKLPAARFERRLASAEAIVEAWSPLVERLSARGVRILFTISPIRHLAYGAHGNQVGKAPLFLAVEEMLGKVANAHYFPAYEILMDELRDYRFYADDMLHPSPLAEEMIWQRFLQTYCTRETRTLCDRIEQLNRMTAHRVLHPDSEEARKHAARLETLRNEVEELMKSYKN